MSQRPQKQLLWLENGSAVCRLGNQRDGEQQLIYIGPICFGVSCFAQSITGSVLRVCYGPEHEEGVCLNCSLEVKWG